MLSAGPVPAVFLSNPVTLLPVLFECGISRAWLCSLLPALARWGRAAALRFGGGSFLAGGEASMQPPSFSCWWWCEL